MSFRSASDVTTAHPRSLMARQREQLENDTSKWDELSQREVERIAHADVFSELPGWHLLPHVDGKKDAPTRYFRAIGTDAFQVKCMVHGRVVRAFDVHPSAELPTV